MADCGGLMIGVDKSEPNTPPLEIENVPPVRSSSVNCPSRALIDIAHDRHDQPARGTDGNADIVIPVIDDIVPVNRGIHDREAFQCRNGRLDEERHQAEPDTVFLFELFTELAAQIQNRLHVHFIERRQRGRLLL